MKSSEKRFLVALSMVCGPGLRLLRQPASLREVARRSLVHYSHLSRIERGLCGASFAVLRRLAVYHGYGFSVIRMLERAKLLQAKQPAKKAKRAKGVA